MDCTNDTVQGLASSMWRQQYKVRLPAAEAAAATAAALPPDAAAAEAAAAAAWLAAAAELEAAEEPPLLPHPLFPPASNSTMAVGAVQLQF